MRADVRDILMGYERRYKSISERIYESIYESISVCVFMSVFMSVFKSVFMSVFNVCVCRRRGLLCWRLATTPPPPPCTTPGTPKSNHACDPETREQDQTQFHRAETRAGAGKECLCPLSFLSRLPWVELSDIYRYTCVRVGI